MGDNQLRSFARYFFSLAIEIIEDNLLEGEEIYLNEFYISLIKRLEEIISEEDFLKIHHSLHWKLFNSINNSFYKLELSDDGGSYMIKRNRNALDLSYLIEVLSNELIKDYGIYFRGRCESSGISF